MIGVAETVNNGFYNFIEFYTDNSIKIVPAPSGAIVNAAPGCADPITGVAVFPDTDAIVVRSSNGTYERKPIGFTTNSFLYNIPGKAFYVVAGGTGKIAEMQYNDDKTSLGSINLLSTDYLGAGPFEVSDQYFHTVTTSSHNNAFRTIKYGGANPTPLLDVVYSPTMKLYYGVACSTLVQVIREQTFNGVGLLMSGAVPMEASWTGSNIDFPKTFWSDYRMGFLTVLK